MGANEPRENVYWTLRTQKKWRSKYTNLACPLLLLAQYYHRKLCTRRYVCSVAVSSLKSWVGMDKLAGLLG